MDPTKLTSALDLWDSLRREPMLDEGAKASGKKAAREPAEQTLTEDRQAMAAPEPAPSLSPGDPSRYELVAEHARGGLGRVLRATDNQLGRTVAVKELLSRSPSTEARFVREAMITARLQHPGIVPVHEAGRWPSGDPYYVMKLISGSTLKERIAGCETLGERLSLLPHVIAVVEAIAYAHSKNIIHRDLKPSNVVVGEFGETVVVDWGLAKDLGEAAITEPASSTPAGSGSSSDATADVVGTPAYMPPEQASGGDVDMRADVYSLGALLYHVLTGAAPYSKRGRESDSSSDKLVQVLDGPPRPVSEIDPAIPSDLVAIVEKAMSRDRRRRYADARELVEDLKRFSTGKLVTAQEYSSVELARRWLQRNKGAVAAAAAVIAATSVLGALAISRIIDERNSARSERAQARAAEKAEAERATELLFQQAVASLERDPTAAIAWLKRYPLDGPRAARLPAMIEEARATGVATHVFTHDDWVHAIDFTADGQKLLSASQDGTVSLWDLASGDRELVMTERAGIRCAAMSRQRSEAAYGSVDGVVVVIDLETRASQTLRGHGAPVTALHFIGDSGLLMSVSDDQTARIWDLQTGRTVRVLEATSKRSRGGTNLAGTRVVEITEAGLIRIHDVLGDRWREIAMPLPSPSQALAVSATGDRLGSVGRDGKVRLIDLERRTIRVLGEHPDQVDVAQFSPAGNRLVTAGNDATVRVWDLEGDAHRVLRGHTDSVYQVDFSPDQTRLISAGDDGTARIWDLRTGAASVLRGHGDDVWRAIWSPDGQRVATASLDGSVRVWPTRFDDSRVLIGHDEPFIAHVDWSGSHLLSQSRGGVLLRWDLETGKASRLATAWPGRQYPHWQYKMPIRFSHDRQMAAALREDGKLDVWNLSTGDHRILAPPAGAGRMRALPALSARGERVACSDGEQVFEWDLAGGATSVIEREDVSALAYDRTGELVMGVIDGGLLERDASGSIRRIKTDGFVNARELLFSRTGAVLAALGRDRVLLIDRKSGDTMSVGSGGHHLMSGAFSEDGERFAAAGADRLVYVWNAESGRELVLAGHGDLVHQVAFSPDGTLLASSSHDQTIRLWELDTGRSRVLRGHGQSVDDIAFSAGGEELASVGRDGTVRIWKVPRDLSSDLATVPDRLESLTTATIREPQAVLVTER